ncbi:hypothetical protein Bbelb_000750 [Branchiostoma belcheri]|nr:hypothetical protein Bbelb_000750 [Branchiostoma belcheri]
MAIRRTTRARLRLIRAENCRAVRRRQSSPCVCVRKELCWPRLAQPTTTKMLLIFVLAVTLIPNYVPISLALPCERSCACYEGAYIAACADRGLFSIPHSFSPTVMQIDLQDNKINQIPRAAFKGISNSSKPSHLNMSNNCLLSVEDHAFETLTNLFTLDLSRNNLSLVTDYSFRGLRRLRYLYLRNNMIKSVSENAFLGIINIRRLNFSGNRLTEVPWPGSAKVLEKFDVSRNLIQTSPAIPNIEPASSLDIWFGENPWSCDCELTHFLKSLETAGDNIHVQDRDKMACAGPENLKGEKAANEIAFGRPIRSLLLLTGF